MLSIHQHPSLTPLRGNLNRTDKSCTDVLALLLATGLGTFVFMEVTHHLLNAQSSNFW